jgi:phosphatidylglycerol:prolipoprotein diacylglycerol transferase
MIPPVNPIIAQVGPFTLTWYGLLLAISAFVGAYIATIEAKRRGENPDHVWNGIIVCIILGIVGARLYHVFSSPAGSIIGWDYYREHPIEIINFWSGGFRGLGVYGALVGGIVGVWLYARYAKLNFLRWLDIAVPGMALAQAIARWGNFINQELYGYPTTLPWGLRIDATHRISPFDDLTKYPVDTTLFHPTFLYESLWNLLVFATLMFIGRRYVESLLDGDLVLLYGILYPLGRFFAEMQRPDAWRIEGIPTAQIIAVIAIVVCGAMLAYRHRATWRPRSTSGT